MKKHLIAAAVAAAVAVPAFAQVSISGYYELGVGNTDYDTAGTDSVSSAGNGLLGSNRFAITGSEDLGGGLKAGFRLESSLASATGAAGSTGAGPDVLFNRGAEVNLSGAFGMIRVGKFDHQGGENTDIVASITGNIGLSNGATTNANNDGPEGVEMGSDRDGTIAYRTPTIMGGFFEVAYTSDDQITAAVSGNAADASGSTAATHTAQGALTSIYYQGAFSGVNVRAGYAKQDKKDSADTHNASRAGVGVTYDFGVAQVGISYARLTTLTNTKNTENIFGIKVPLAGGLDVRATYQDYDANGSAATSADFKQLDLALVKSLSKRTNVYAAYSDIDMGTGATGTSGDRAVAQVGITHSF
jgi:predicted porin